MLQDSDLWSEQIGGVSGLLRELFQTSYTNTLQGALMHLQICVTLPRVLGKHKRLWLKTTFQKYRMPQQSKSSNFSGCPKSSLGTALSYVKHCPLVERPEWVVRWCVCVSTPVCVCPLLCVCVPPLHCRPWDCWVCLRHSLWCFMNCIHNSYCLFHWSNPLVFPRTSRFASFPEYLVVQIKKFTFGLDWVPKKFGRYLLHAFA